MKHLAASMKRDERRSMADMAETQQRFAPHVIRSGVGFAEPPWYPGEGQEEEERKADDGPLQDSSTVDVNEVITRDKTRVGGLLSELTIKPAISRLRFSLNPNHSNSIEFNRIRKTRIAADTLASITAKIEHEKNLYLNKENPNASSPPKSKLQGMVIRRPLQDNGSEDASIIDKISRSKVSPSLLAKENKSSREYKRSSKILDLIQQFKAIHRSAIIQERSREIERKRRMLSQEEAKRKGPPPDEPNNAYDYYATRVQTQVRRWQAMRYLAWYRMESYRASKAIQTRTRGMCARIKTKRMKLEKTAVTEIQRNFRGMSTRVMLTRIICS
jgi:hypothetical protein